MRNLYRKLLLLSSLGLFLLVSPLIILYAVGYRFDLSSREPQPVGVILVESSPRRAQITVNGQPAGRTPDAVTGLPINDYEISLKRPGYVSWAKRIRVQPIRATELRNVILFPEKITPSLLADEIKSFSLSPSRRLVAVIHPNKSVSVIDEAGVEVVPPIIFKAQIAEVLWDPNSSSLIISDDTNKRWLLDLALRVPQPLDELLDISNFAWDLRIPGRVLFLNNDKELWALNVSTGASTIIASDVMFFAPALRYVYVIHSGNEVAVYTPQGQRTNIEQPAPEGLIDNIMVTPAGRITYQIKNGGLWVVNDDDELLELSPTASRAGWSPDGQLLYYMPDPYSLHIFNAGAETHTTPKGQTQLIVRLSNPIVNPQWFAGSRHLIYQVKDEIHIIETDTRDHPIDFQVTSTNLGNADPAVGENGHVVFYMAKDKSATGLYSAPLILPTDK